MARGAKINGAMKGYGLGVSVGAASYRHCWGLRLRTSNPVFYLPPSARMAVPHGRHRQDHNQGISQGDGAGRSRQQLPPQIRKVEIFDRGAGKTVVKYQLRVDGGVNPATGQRQQVKRRFATEKQARAALAEISDQALTGAFVARTAFTVEQVCADYLAGRHNLRQTSSAKLDYDLAPLREHYGDMPVQRLTKAHLDALVADLVAGGTKTA
jgi:hypothetical protein